MTLFVLILFVLFCEKSRKKKYWERKKQFDEILDERDWEDGRVECKQQINKIIIIVVIGQLYRKRRPVLIHIVAKKKTAKERSRKNSVCVFAIESLFETQNTANQPIKNRRHTIWLDIINFANAFNKPGEQLQ